MISHWDDVEPSAAERGHICGRLAVAHRRTRPTGRRSADPDRRRGGGRRRSTSRGRRRRSSTCSPARACPCSETERRGGVRGRAGRLPRPSRARARAHAAGRPGGPRRARLRRAPLRREHAPAEGGRLLARADVGARGRAGRPPLEAGGRGGPPEVGELVGAAAADRQRRRRRAGDAAKGRRSRGSPRSRPCRGLGQDGHQALRGATRQALNPPHCHCAEEEIFVVLEGDGTLELWPHLAARRRAREPRRAPGQRRRAPGRDRSGAHVPGRRRRADRSSPTGRAIRTTSRTTLARAR